MEEYKAKRREILVTLISLVTLHYLAGYRHLRAGCWYSRVDYNAKISDQTTLVSFQSFYNHPQTSRVDAIQIYEQNCV